VEGEPRGGMHAWFWPVSSTVEVCCWSGGLREQTEGATGRGILYKQDSLSGVRASKRCACSTRSWASPSVPMTKNRLLETGTEIYTDSLEGQ